MTTALPELWTDWCSVAGVPEKRVDEATLSLFSRQASPSRAVLARLRRLIAPEHAVAPAWPRTHRDDPESLRRLVRCTTVMVQDPSTHWVLRLRLRRMLFAAVLIAPPSHGGLGLDRARALALRPDGMRRLRPRIGVADEPRSCPACAVWSWLDVIGTNNGWSHGAVRALGHRRDEEGWEHRHLLPDASPDWLLCVGMLPAVDRWGWVDIYSSMHPSSLSTVISATDLMLKCGPTPVPAPAPEPRPIGPRREISREEEEKILARADELTVRVTEILREYG
ncbi:hypothetical protein [Saccharopolyspora shandongensis]|uniref:hypothetical protein n=1 Tax=Saccharopolyspora shandongensis TaxID=418495 RepID=UPI0033E34755